MIVFKRGSKMQPKYLTAVLAERHDMMVKAQDERLAKRAERNAPETDEPPCEACGREVKAERIGPFEGLEHLDGLRVVFRSLSLGDVRGYRLRQLEAASKVSENDVDSLIAAERQSSEVKREAVVAMVASIEGLANEDGSDIMMPAADKLSDDELDLLEDNAIIDALFTAGLHLQDLTDEARKNSGASQRLTSAHSIATHAQDIDAKAGDATIETDKGEAVQMMSISGPTTTATMQPAHALNGSLSETQTSAPRLSLPANSEMMA